MVVRMYTYAFVNECIFRADTRPQKNAISGNDCFFVSPTSSHHSSLFAIRPTLPSSVYSPVVQRTLSAEELPGSLCAREIFAPLIRRGKLAHDVLAVDIAVKVEPTRLIERVSEGGTLLSITCLTCQAAYLVNL